MALNRFCSEEEYESSDAHFIQAGTTLFKMGVFTNVKLLHTFSDAGNLIQVYSTCYQVFQRKLQ